MMVPVITPAKPAMMLTGWVATPSPNSRSCSVPDIPALPGPAGAYPKNGMMVYMPRGSKIASTRSNR